MVNRQHFQKGLDNYWKQHYQLNNLRTIRDQMKGDFGQKVKQLNDLTAVLIDQK